VDDDKLNKIYENFLSLADSKKEVTDDDVLVLAGQERNRSQAIKLD
jgi:2-isopropylmalate synthase